MLVTKAFLNIETIFSIKPSLNKTFSTKLQVLTYLEENKERPKDKTSWEPLPQM